jgi:hypothetical protein
VDFFEGYEKVQVDPAVLTKKRVVYIPEFTQDHDFHTKMSWYKIPEIRFSDYVECLKDVYAAREAPIVVHPDDRDPFTQAVLPFSEENEIFRQREKNVSMKLGYFHQKLAGKFPGYKTLKDGHESGLDVIKEDGTELWEWKNRHNTMNSSSARGVEDKLLKALSRGMKAFLVQVNCPNGKVCRYKMAGAIIILNGKQAYERISGRENFFDDLQSTIASTFEKFSTWTEIQQFVAQLPVPVSPGPRCQSVCTEQIYHT